MRKKGCIIAGSSEELSNNKDKIGSFERLRSADRNVEIITYDEVLSKIQMFLDLLEETKD